jgi:hypothetical protein
MCEQVCGGIAQQLGDLEAILKGAEPR